MATIAPKTFFANLFDQAGTLAKVDNALVFFGNDGDITTVEPDMVNYLVVLGEVGVSNTQALLDRLHGGAARIACARQMEVA